MDINREIDWKKTHVSINAILQTQIQMNYGSGSTKIILDTDIQSVIGTYTNVDIDTDIEIVDINIEIGNKNSNKYEIDVYIDTDIEVETLIQIQISL